MSNPTKVIKYKNTCTLNVQKADNRLDAFINPDAKAGGGTIFAWESRIAGGAPPNASVDLTRMLNNVGPSNLAFIGTNYEAGGAFAINVKTDVEPMPFTVSENLPEWTSKQWTVRIERV